jgi:hypothetical protein
MSICKLNVFVMATEEKAPVEWAAERILGLRKSTCRQRFATITTRPRPRCSITWSIPASCGRSARSAASGNRRDRLRLRPRQRRTVAGRRRLLQCKTLPQPAAHTAGAGALHVPRSWALVDRVQARGIPSGTARAEMAHRAGAALAHSSPIKPGSATLSGSAKMAPRPSPKSCHFVPNRGILS